MKLYKIYSTNGEVTLINPEHISSIADLTVYTDGSGNRLNDEDIEYSTCITMSNGDRHITPEHYADIAQSILSM